jgi:hypothetical protein
MRLQREILHVQMMEAGDESCELECIHDYTDAMSPMKKAMALSARSQTRCRLFSIWKSK